MPSLPFPNTGSALVILESGRPARNLRAYVYADALLTIPAEIYADVGGVKGDRIPAGDDGRVSFRLDAHGRQTPYWGPASGADRLWVLVNGVANRVDADYDPRLDAFDAVLASVSARLDALEEGSGPPDPPPTPGSSFALDPDNPLIVTTVDTNPGIDFDGNVVVVATDTAGGVAVSGNVLVVTV